VAGAPSEGEQDAQRLSLSSCSGTFDHALSDADCRASAKWHHRRTCRKVAPSGTLRGIAGEDTQRLHEDNRAAWNEAAQAYASRIDETVASLRAGCSNLHPLERANLHDLAEWCECAIHLQCASGRDTLSLWVEGAKRVVGIDISDRHIENARRMAAALAAPAIFYRSDVLDAPRELDGTADLVYSGRGALWWLHDINAWAAVVYRLLKPGGILHVLDDHPLSWLFDLDADQLVPSGYDYFSLEADSSRGWPTSYLTLDIADEQQSIKHERHWTLAQIHQALVDTDLIVERLGEHPESYWPAFPNLTDEVRSTIPNSFTIVSRKPGTDARPS
jgi:SAM-dependent methyltransferase